MDLFEQRRSQHLTRSTLFLPTLNKAGGTNQPCTGCSHCLLWGYNHTKNPLPTFRPARSHPRGKKHLQRCFSTLLQVSCQHNQSLTEWAVTTISDPTVSNSQRLVCIQEPPGALPHQEPQATVVQCSCSTTPHTQ